MVEIQGLSLEQLADLYDASTPNLRKWMHDHIDLWKGKPLKRHLYNMFR